MDKKMVYFFGKDMAEGSSDMKDLLGGKGANLSEMASIGLPVPPGFTITTDVCLYYTEHDKQYPEGLKESVDENIKKLENVMGRQFGSKDNPLLVSVRSGAPISMPGMMDTILNLGLNDETVKGLSDLTDNERFAYDSYRRFVQMYGNVVLKIEGDKFESIIKRIKKENNVSLDIELTAENLKNLVKEYKELILKETGNEFPDNVNDQLWNSINAVFGSWDNQRAIDYRNINNIPHDLGTAVNVQTMVYGNMGENSATGVAFTRNPSNGDNHFYGEYLINAQGEDVVAGIRTPQPLNDFSRSSDDQKTLEEMMPEIYKQLYDIRSKLEAHYKDTQDLEFTVEEGKLWMLQTRTGKRTPLAAIKMAVDYVKEGIIDKETAVLRVKPSDIDGMLHPMIDPDEEKEVLAKGLPASPGAASGRIVLTAKEAVEKAKNEKELILVREETSPEDISGMDACNGILTARGGMTSHAAVVARGMGKPCIVGCSDMEIDYEKRIIKIRDLTLKDGDFITIDGTSGEVLKGEVKKIKPKLQDEFGKLMEWTDEFKKLEIRTNADTPEDSKVARNFGAKGIGLCRTEHMFFGEERINAVREMILAENDEGRKKALEKILPMQREDFEGIFRVMDGFPVVIRTLDPPLHEFLPKEEEQINILAGKIGIKASKLKQKVDDLQESNPMLGHRGCRLGITYPQITEMQVRAIIEAACNVKKENIDVLPEIMIPLIGNVNELTKQKEIVIATAQQVMKEKDIEIEYLVGTMIELPRAALTSGKIAPEAEFFSFGTNDLTQTTLGFSRDDVGPILESYRNQGILEHDPFATLDQEGVGRLIRISIEDGKKANPDLEIGICGEHGGDPSSIEFFNKNGFDYVSCSPYRVPVARLAAAQSEIKRKKE
ncbi:MAG: pyruvate, phosphate dikinase [candidate division WOR-3 bacterium]|nr:pyruvate, phosphate dikinase [candidate division WOR-3 bacterium]